MSLLLDALKRAEQEKLTRQGDRPAPAPVAERPAPTASATIPTLELQPIASPGASPAPAGLSTAPKGDAHAAQALFRAKAGVEAPRNRSALFAAAGAIVVLVLAAGAYVWYSLHTLTPRPVMARARPTPIAPPPADANAPRPESIVAPTQVPPLLQPAQAIQPPAPADGGRAPASMAEASPLIAMLRESAPRTAAPPVMLERTVDKPRIPAQVSKGYDALRAGDLGVARASYESALAADPANVDALLGLATIDAREGKRVPALGRYRAVLQVDPRNATALAGIAALTQDARPEAVETQLRIELGQYPQSSALHASLGNTLAAQARWSEAQDEYFEAHRLEPDNADIAYNLAVALDHLGQAKLAAQFYHRALDGARSQATQFDPEPAARRLAQLQR